MPDNDSIPYVIRTSDVSKARVTGNIKARYALRKWAGESRKHAFCHVRSVGADSVKFVASQGAEMGDHVAVVVPEIGLLAGKITRTIGPLCTMEVSLPADRKAEVEKRIGWMERRTAYNLRERRQDSRFKLDDPVATVFDVDGNSHACKVVDISTTGAGIECDFRPRMGELVWLGAVHGSVVRIGEGGFGIAFTERQDANALPVLVKETEMCLL